MVRSPGKRWLTVAAALVLSACVVAGCGGGDDTTAGGTTEAEATGTITSPSAANADSTAVVPLSDGSSAVVAAYLPDDPRAVTRVRAKVGHLVALVAPTIGESSAAGGSADGTIAELVGEGPAISTNTDLEFGNAFTYRVTAAGTGTLNFRWEAPSRVDEFGTVPGFSTTLKFSLTATG